MNTNIQTTLWITTFDPFVQMTYRFHFKIILFRLLTALVPNDTFVVRWTWMRITVGRRDMERNVRTSLTEVPDAVYDIFEVGKLFETNGDHLEENFLSAKCRYEG